MIYRDLSLFLESGDVPRFLYHCAYTILIYFSSDNSSLWREDSQLFLGPSLLLARQSQLGQSQQEQSQAARTDNS
jgi:hypothetical protein